MQACCSSLLDKVGFLLDLPARLAYSYISYTRSANNTTSDVKLFLCYGRLTSLGSTLLFCFEEPFGTVLHSHPPHLGSTSWLPVALRVPTLPRLVPSGAATKPFLKSAHF